MVRRFSGRSLEIKVEHFLREWNENILSTVAPIDIELFTEQYAGADINWFRLSNGNSILGLTCLEERPVMVLSEDGAHDEVVTGHEGMIIVCPAAWEEGGDARGRFTVAHECSHVLLHSADDITEQAGMAAHHVGIDPARELADDPEERRLGEILLWLQARKREHKAQEKARHEEAQR